MTIDEKMKAMAGEPGTAEQKLYRILLSDEYATDGFEKYRLGEGMQIVNQSIRGWWKPRFLLNHNLQTAYEWIHPDEKLASVGASHVDWDSMMGLPEEAVATLHAWSFHFPSFIRDYENGIALVRWQLIPDGRYWEDEDGFGMTGDEELNIYGFIDTRAQVVSPFRYYTRAEISAGALKEARREAERKAAPEGL